MHPGGPPGLLHARSSDDGACFSGCEAGQCKPDLPADSASRVACRYRLDGEEEGKGTARLSRCVDRTVRHQEVREEAPEDDRQGTPPSPRGDRRLHRVAARAEARDRSPITGRFGPTDIRSGVIWRQGRRRWLCALISIESRFFACPTQSPAARNAFASEAPGFTFGCA